MRPTPTPPVRPSPPPPHPHPRRRPSGSASFLLLGLLALAGGCSGEGSDPAKYSDKEKWIIERARGAVAQQEDWEARAEYRIKREDGRWHVTAWRVEHPEAKGNQRYLPWGHREIFIDDAGKVVAYKSTR